MSLDQLAGRIASMLGFARITATKGLDGEGIRRVQLTFDEAETRDRTLLVQHYGIASRPNVGADAVVTFLGGNRSFGMIIATNDRRYQIELSEGEVALHTDEGDSVHLKRGRVVKITAGTKLEIAAPLVTITGNLQVAEDVTAGTVSLRTHRHGQVQTGSGQSGVPIP